MAQNLRISELSYDDIVGNSQEANSPSMLKMLQNFTSATFHWASAGFKIADDETLAKRQAICDTCQYWKASARLGMGKCLKCGCYLAKLKLARMPYREVVKKSLSGFRKALLVFGCYEILLSSAIRRESKRQSAEYCRISGRFGNRCYTY